MATIGTFKKTSTNEFAGEIVTLSVQAKGVRIVPEANRANDNAPSHRVMVGRAEIGGLDCGESVPPMRSRICLNFFGWFHSFTRSRSSVSIVETVVENETS